MDDSWILLLSFDIAVLHDSTKMPSMIGHQADPGSMSIFAVKFLTRTNPYRRRRDCNACPEEFLRCEGLPLLSWETNAPVAKSWREGHQMAATTPSPWQHKNDSSGIQARWDFVGDVVLQLCAYVLTQTESERYGIPCSTIFLSQWQTHQWQAPPIFARATGPGKQEWIFKTLQHFQLSSRSIIGPSAWKLMHSDVLAQFLTWYLHKPSQLDPSYESNVFKCIIIIRKK